MTEKYENIVMLVHPLYDLLFNHMNYLTKNGEITIDELNKAVKKILNNPRVKHQLVTTIAEYKQEILKYKADPLTLVIIYLPTVKETTLDYIFNNISKDFIPNFKKIFKERLVVSNRFVIDEDLSKIPLKKLSRNLKLIAFGEYKNICVTDYLNNLASQLEERGFKTRSKILSRKSYSSSSGRYPGLDHKARFRPLKRFVRKPI